MTILRMKYPTLKSFMESTFPRDFLETPDKYLGPNYCSVMNFYSLFYSNRLRLIDPERGTTSIIRNTRYENLLQKEVLQIIPNEIKIRLPYPFPVFELITMHRLLELGETLKYVPLFTAKDEPNS